jgi:uncharacterized protein
MYKRSRYTLQAKHNDKVYLFNTFTGQGDVYDTGVLSILKNPDASEPAFETLVKGGHLVSKGDDEIAIATRQHASQMFRNDVLHLIIMPTEQCNFRCTYCYEKFELGTMQKQLREAIILLVERRAPQLNQLSISWFGGEPLVAKSVVLELSEAFKAMSKTYGFAYIANATTNGYHLTPDISPRYIKLGIKEYQITLDGPARYHDAKRKLQHGGSTFERIWDNLIFLKHSPHDFSITLRINIDEENYPVMPAFIQTLSDAFGHDERFSLHLHKVGRWGGENDDNLAVLEQDKSLLHFYEQGQMCGLDPHLSDGFKPFGATCYAAKPYSFLIRADGRLNKCTIALDDERNEVGRLLADGSLLLNQDKLNPWIFNGALTDTGCQACSLRPACQGSSCPLIRMNTGERPCPDTKTAFKQYLPLMLDNAIPLEVAR